VIDVQICELADVRMRQVGQNKPINPHICTLTNPHIRVANLRNVDCFSGDAVGGFSIIF